MKLILIVALLISFGNDPAMLLSLDDDHSLELLSEHGVDHLVLFHRADHSENYSDTYFANPSSHEHHEVHLSSSTGLIQKKIQTSFQTEISSAAEHTYALNTVTRNSASTFEPDVGSARLTIPVLRI